LLNNREAYEIYKVTLETFGKGALENPGYLFLHISALKPLIPKLKELAN
jgi:hypothetical protein